MCTKLIRTGLILVVTAPMVANAQNFIRNPGFETAQEGLYGQGLLPDDWLVYSFSPDTYSNDGRFGLWPSEFGNFPGVLAHGGKRWVAGADMGPISEDFHQILDAPLESGVTYEVSGWLHQALRPDLNFPAGYGIGFGNGPSVAHLGDTASSADGWTYFSSTFVAVGGENDIVFHSLAPGDGVGYPGIDDVSLVAVPEPVALVGLGVGSLLAGILRRRTR